MLSLHIFEEPEAKSLDKKIFINYYCLGFYNNNSVDSSKKLNNTNLKFFNYYFTSKNKEGEEYSNRYNLESKYFQSWLGVYILDMSASKLNNVNNIKKNLNFKYYINNIIIEDHKIWLKHVSKIKYPIAFLEDSSNIDIKLFPTINGDVYVVNFTIISSVDVGNSDTNNINKLFKVPVETIPIEIYSKLIYLKCTIFVSFLEKENIITIAYFNGVEFNYKNKKYDTYNLIKDEYMKTLLSCQLEFQRK